jgi:hypothetical protein
VPTGGRPLATSTCTCSADAHWDGRRGELARTRP